MRNTLILLLLLVSLIGSSQEKKAPLTSRQVHSLTLLGELWGFLKYYHPSVAQGHQDWDSVLVKKIPLYLGASGKEDIDRLTADWLTETGTPPVCRSCDNHVPDSCKFNLDLSWINGTSFSGEVADRLLYIRDNRSQGNNRFVSLISYTQLQTNENAYNTPDFLYPSAEYRLLLLFRYWNIVNYFSPYKYLCGKDWKLVLEDEIPRFYGAADTLSYHLEYVRLISCLNDGHANFHTTSTLQQAWGSNHYPPFGCRMIDGQLVVNKIYNKAAMSMTPIKLGDVLISVNGEDVKHKMARFMEYVPASNDVAKVEFFTIAFLFTSPDSNLVVTRTRNGSTITDTFVMPHGITPARDASRPWRILDGNIGYVDMERLSVPQVDTMMIELSVTRGIIFDLRNYPDNTWQPVTARLANKPFFISRIANADINYPGVFRFEKPYYIKNASHHYTGQVVVLADEISVSHSEYSIMGFQAATKVTTIGSTTAGQDGDISRRIMLPGGLFTRFSSIGIFYPDGSPAQRTGVRIDKTVLPTIRGLQEGRDEVLGSAVAYIKEH